jgi:flagellar biosynthetic protein FliQ
MSETDIIAIFHDALWTTLVAIAPAMAASLAVGLVVALGQALTQVQEVTLTYVPKIVAVFLVLGLSSAFMLRLVTTLMERMSDRIVAL